MSRLSLPLARYNPPDPPAEGLDQKGLVDGFGRIHRSLRLSLTDQCNLRCGYCMEEDTQFLPRSSRLEISETVEIARLFVSMGIRKIRLTGGEPLLRSDVVELVFELKKLAGLHELAMTTNGILLERYARGLREAGLDRLTISLDTLREDVFRRIARRPGLERVLAGIEESLRCGFQDIAINAVPIRNVNDRELPELVTFAHARGIRPRFIETMPIGAGEFDSAGFFPAKEIIETLRLNFGQVEELPAEKDSSTARLYQVRSGVFGVIASVTEPFCGSCDRLRITADGKLRTCLFSLEEFDLRPLIRGKPRGKELQDLVRKAVWSKQPGHGIDQAGFVKPTRTMHAIGG